MADAVLPGKNVGIANYPNAKAGYKKGGRIKAQHGYNSGRTNLLEEVGRIDAERMNPNRRAEKRRVISQLNRGLKGGGAVLPGKKAGIQL